MDYIGIFRRYEIKYLVTEGEAKMLLKRIEPYITPDSHGRSIIRNLYFDTPDYRMIRRSIEKPEYKEKLRLRCYSLPTHSSTIYAEIKKKYHGVVYKRRVAISEGEAIEWLTGDGMAPIKSQIAREIDYMRHLYCGLMPSAYISYSREAYFADGQDDFRLTVDRDIMARCERLSLCEDVGGERILPPDMTLIEIKCRGGMPLWMVKALSDMKIYKSSYSKYGTAYSRIIFKSKEIT